ncbi:MAG: asparagine synthase (glutamine-hydrolyzing), partial [Deltaproteobacteria bacterium]|nr:asparagine synthase (glutamine-hydrolyzing) [Deltaproteobacteria bacterium]
LTHRGPDDAGNYISPDRKVGLGTRRLKILDLTPAGHMPMGVEGAWITYNGEVYNFQELRDELKKLGRSFRSTGDTEVILNAYLTWGPDFVKRLNGMFAFVIWDEKERRVFAARDHMGIKPLYYTLQNGSFYFGSEIKAILAHPDIKRELNEEALSHYLTFSSAPAPCTLFRGIKKLPAGHSLIIRSDGSVKETEYWNPVRSSRVSGPEGTHGFAAGATSNGMESLPTESEYIDEVRSLLRDSIKKQMVSDVPFGCFLSGGIDSSTNAALMSEALGRPVETFSVGYRDFPEMNEFVHSRDTAERLGIAPHELFLDKSHLETFLARYADHFDDPNGDPAALPLYWLSKLARENGVIVVQIGEGADELFAGYHQYLRAVRLYGRWWRWLEKLPSFARRGSFSASAVLPGSQFDPHREYLRRLAEHQEPFWGLAK